MLLRPRVPLQFYLRISPCAAVCFRSADLEPRPTGKQARGGNPDEQLRVKRDNSPPQQEQPLPQRHTAPNVSEPVFGHAPAGHHQAVPDAFSAAAPGGAQNRAAQAGHAAAHHAEAGQSISKAKNQRLDDHNIAKLVAEENASRGKFPRYPGLERWELVEKMGDGAFSNVYRARDLEGGAGEVAIKVVRKFEMNNMQVRGRLGNSGFCGKQPCSPTRVPFLDSLSFSSLLLSFICFKFPFTNWVPFLGT